MTISKLNTKLFFANKKVNELKEKNRKKSETISTLLNRVEELENQGSYVVSLKKQIDNRERTIIDRNGHINALKKTLRFKNKEISGLQHDKQVMYCRHKTREKELEKQLLELRKQNEILKEKMEILEQVQAIAQVNEDNEVVEKQELTCFSPGQITDSLFTLASGTDYYLTKEFSLKLLSSKEFLIDIQDLSNDQSSFLVSFLKSYTLPMLHNRKDMTKVESISELLNADCNYEKQKNSLSKENLSSFYSRITRLNQHKITMCDEFSKFYNKTRHKEVKACLYVFYKIGYKGKQPTLKQCERCINTIKKHRKMSDNTISKVLEKCHKLGRDFRAKQELKELMNIA